MATVSNPASLSSVQAVFGGPGNLAAYVRGGAYVPSGASSTISTTVANLMLSQFNGVSSVVSMTATASPTAVGAGASAPAAVTTASTTATPSGGTAPYTYLWAYYSGDTTVSIGTPNAAMTNFTTSINGTSGTKIANFQCKVTDSVGNVAYTGVVQATFTYSGTLN